jgi:ABC-type molybdate transport system ATPase subunit
MYPKVKDFRTTLVSIGEVVAIKPKIIPWGLAFSSLDHQRKYELFRYWKILRRSLDRYKLYLRQYTSLKDHKVTPTI